MFSEDRFAPVLHQADPADPPEKLEKDRQFAKVAFGPDAEQVGDQLLC